MEISRVTPHGNGNAFPSLAQSVSIRFSIPFGGEQFWDIVEHIHESPLNNDSAFSALHSQY
eukprot:8600700-Pyramimonas_sp.AAC.2